MRRTLAELGAETREIWTRAGFHVCSSAEPWTAGKTRTGAIHPEAARDAERECVAGCCWIMRCAACGVEFSEAKEFEDDGS